MMTYNMFLVVLLFFLNQIYTYCLSYDSFGNIKRMAIIVETYNISVIFKTYKTNQIEQTEDVLGTYDPYTYDITLYNTPTTLSEFTLIHENTFKHELIHSIQHCKGNRLQFEFLMNDTSILNCILGTDIDITFINDYYSDSSEYIRRLEYEAYCLENIISYEIISQLLNKYCLKSF